LLTSNEFIDGLDDGLKCLSPIKLQYEPPKKMLADMLELEGQVEHTALWDA